jgi:hypothetical protein
LNAIIERRYDKGDRRKKHVHSGSVPIIEHVGNNPKFRIGKCPSGMSGSLLNQLINEAIPTANAETSLAFPKRIYVVHQGAIYEAQTSDHGRSYHGYPYAGKLRSTLIDSLRVMAVGKGCLEQFEDWVARHIERHGR